MYAVEQVEDRQTPREKLLSVEAAVGDRVLEREEEIRGFICSLLTRNHILYLGLHGAAKSMLSRLLCDAISWHEDNGEEPYFRAPLGKDSTTDEVFGPLSNAGFKNDTFVRQTAGMISRARIAFLDELFDSNAAVLRKMNTPLVERKFKNGTEPEVDIPLELMVGASNFTPEPDANLEAFFDRFILRYEVSYIKEPENFRALIRRANENYRPEDLPPMISEDDLARARAGVNTVDAAGVLGALEELWVRLEREGIHLSPRRYYSLVSIIKANAYLEGRTEASHEDLMILRHAVWEEPDQIPTVTSLVLSVAKPEVKEAQDILDDLSKAVTAAIETVARTDYRTALEADKSHATGLATEAITKTYRAQNKLLELYNQAKEARRNHGAIEAFLVRVEALRKEVGDKCFDTEI